MSVGDAQAAAASTHSATRFAPRRGRRRAGPQSPAAATPGRRAARRARSRSGRPRARAPRARAEQVAAMASGALRAPRPMTSLRQLCCARSRRSRRRAHRLPRGSAVVAPRSCASFTVLQDPLALARRQAAAARASRRRRGPLDVELRRQARGAAHDVLAACAAGRRSTAATRRSSRPRRSTCSAR